MDYDDSQTRRSIEDAKERASWPDDEEEPETDEWRGVYPGMCIDPEICRGKTHCPRNFSCCE